jgi:hypothetical protein
MTEQDDSEKKRSGIIIKTRSVRVKRQRGPLTQYLHLLS